MIWHASIHAARRRGVVWLYMVSTFKRVWINLGMVANPARSQLIKRVVRSYLLKCRWITGIV